MATPAPTRAVGGAAWRRFLAPHYLANFAVLLSYVYLRQWVLQHFAESSHTRLKTAEDLTSKERSTFPLLCLTVGFKYLRKQSWDDFFSHSFFYGKAVVGVMLFYGDTRLLIAFLVTNILMFLLLPQPIYKGPTAVEVFTPASFKEAVLDRANCDWLVELFAPWAPACVHLEPVLAELSLEYTTSRLKFGKLDVSRWPVLAKQYGADTSGASGQVPTLLLFEKGKETERLPQVFSDGSVGKARFLKADIVTAFSLDQRRSKPEEQPGSNKGASRRRR